MKTLPIETPSLFGEYPYPEAKELKEKQQDIAWTDQEIPVEDDIQDFRVNMSPKQFEVTSITLDLFVEIEQKVGDIWSVISGWFPHAEIDGACTVIAAMEKGVHAFFYQKMSDKMNRTPEEVAKNQQTIAVLRDKLQMLEDITKNPMNKPLTLFTVACIEQVLLFSNFALLKSFQANGHNLIKNTITGVDFVVQDETIHGVFASYLFNNYVAEYKEMFKESPIAYTEIFEVVTTIISHEDSVIEYLFRDTDEINGVTEEDFKSFIRLRMNDVLISMGYGAVYTVTDTKIDAWFYKGVKSIKLHDFFVSGTNQYRRGWSGRKLSRLKYIKGEK